MEEEDDRRRRKRKRRRRKKRLHPNQLESQCGEMGIFFYFMCTGILPACMSANHMRAVPSEARKS